MKSFLARRHAHPPTFPSGRRVDPPDKRRRPRMGNARAVVRLGKAAAQSKYANDLAGSRSSIGQEVAL